MFSRVVDASLLNSISTLRKCLIHYICDNTYLLSLFPFSHFGGSIVMVAVQSVGCVWLLDCSSPGSFVLCCLLEVVQIHVHWVGGISLYFLLVFFWYLMRSGIFLYMIKAYVLSFIVISYVILNYHYMLRHS